MWCKAPFLPCSPRGLSAPDEEFSAHWNKAWSKKVWEALLTAKDREEQGGKKAPNCPDILAYLEKRCWSSSCWWPLLPWSWDWCSNGIKLTWSRKGRGREIGRRRGKGEVSNLSCCGFMWVRATIQERKDRRAARRDRETGSSRCLLA